MPIDDYLFQIKGSTFHFIRCEELPCFICEKKLEPFRSNKFINPMAMIHCFFLDSEQGITPEVIKEFQLRINTVHWKERTPTQLRSGVFLTQVYHHILVFR